MEGPDVREMSFQNVLDTILKPAGVKVGGFPQEMFQDLSEEEAEQYSCNICFLIVNECRQCDNRHLFCHTCSFAWTMTYGENSQKCPMCRCDQGDYKQNKEVDKVLMDKRVHCQEEGCGFKSPLKIFLMHSHGKMKYSNGHVELESLRPARPTGARLLVLPSLGIFGPSSMRQQRGTVIRHQLQQGRAMIHQMMTLLQLEMQLRQQSLVSYQRAMEPMARVQRLDEVLALNEQLNEIGMILSALLSTPLTSQRTGLPDSAGGAASGSSSRTPVRESRLTSLLMAADDDDDDDSSSDSSSSDSSLDLSLFSQRNASLHRTNGYPPSSMLNRPPVLSLASTLNEGRATLDQARERRQASQQILSQSSTSAAAAERDSSSTTDPILIGREPGMTPRIGPLNRAQDRPGNVLSSRDGDSTATITSVMRLSTSNANSIHGANSIRNVSGSQAETRNASSGGNGAQLPSLAGTVASHSMQSTTDALSTASSLPRDQSRQDTPSPVSREPTPPPIPQGSLALRQAMEAMNRSRTPSSTASHASGTSSTGTASSGNSNAVLRARSTSQSQGTAARSRQDADETASAADRDGRQSRASSASTSAPSAQGRRPGSPSADATTASREGSILPPSLYRRRQRTESSLSGRSSNAESGLGTTPTSLSRTTTQFGRVQNGSQDQRSQPVTSRRRIAVGVSQPNQRDMTRRVNISRRNLLPNRPVVNRTISTSSQHSSDGGTSTLSSSGPGPHRATAATNNRIRPGGSRTSSESLSALPKLPDGHSRSRRRSEIHQNLLMKK